MKPAAQWLSDPLTNKGTAYSREERICRQLDGVRPPRLESLGEQADRMIANLRGKVSPLEQYCSRL